ncbi:chemotaxis protein CheB [Streptomyces sp. S.PB5]|uniref:chemotaxis protein CheB n=1 Tax=Streptomyces sp. S.PB5 TaxID=3020844 RepID=UPI0025AFE92C|nr:chemotaxis protein CheB [Streptomyces sp. S.PB5]MDN3020711.1 chemotaxis protein CheB [Streptomyces sp. S.PB5]
MEHTADDHFDVVAVAASAGGITGLVTVLGDLGDGLPVPVLVVQHLDPRHRTVIAEVLGRRTPLRVKLAEEHEQAVAGTVYIAPPNRHLLVAPGGRLALTDTELVHFVRPSADLLFESVAGAYGPRAIACVLTGTGRDGAMGVDAVKQRGGTVIVQDPATAEFKGMPEAAVGTGKVDFVLPLEEIAAVIRGLVETKRQ